VPASAVSTVEGILRVAISSQKMSGPVPLLTWNRETGIKVYLLEIRHTSLKENFLTMKL